MTGDEIEGKGKPSPMPNEVQLLGLPSVGPVTLSGDHVHGSRNLLLENPESVHLYIRTKQIGQKRPASRGPRWRAFTGKLIPVAGRRSPTVFNGTVHGSLQEALLACLLWFAGGATKALQYTFRPLGPDSFPMLQIEDGADVGLSSGSLSVHLLATEPSHAEYRQLGQTMLATKIDRCMLLYGQLQTGVIFVRTKTHRDPTRSKHKPAVAGRTMPCRQAVCPRATGLSPRSPGVRLAALLWADGNAPAL